MSVNKKEIDYSIFITDQLIEMNYVQSLKIDSNYIKYFSINKDNSRFNAYYLRRCNYCLLREHSKKKFSSCPECRKTGIQPIPLSEIL